MQISITRWSLRAAVATLATAALLGACGKPDPNKAASAVPTDQTSQTATPPPPGDSTPKPADSSTRSAAEANEKPAGSAAGQQSTVGTAASGAPPYTLQGAPEGNQAPKGGEAPKK
jgi:hypothetical protein